MKPFIISKRTPPPPHRGTSNRQLRILALLFAAASGALLLTACDSPTGDNPNTNTTAGKVIPPKVTPPKVTPPIVEPPKTYNTTVKGKVVTPARAADPAKGSIITTARVWSSIDPANKVPVDSTDGSYSLQVANHTGNFTITAEYTAADGKYKTSAPKTIPTKDATIENQDIPLNYGHTTEVTVRVSLQSASGAGRFSSGVTVVITAENGHEVGRGITSGAASPRAVITVDHPGDIVITASRSGYWNDPTSNAGRVDIPTTARAFTQSLSLSLIPPSP